MLDAHTRRGLGGLHDTHDTYDTYDTVIWKSAVASPLLTHTRRGLGGLHDTHDTYDTYDIVIWKIGGSFGGIRYTRLMQLLHFFTFPILSTLPWYLSGIFTFSILSARVVRFPHTRRRPALYTLGLCPFNKTNSRRIIGYDTLILHTLGWHVYDALILW